MLCLEAIQAKARSMNHETDWADAYVARVKAALAGREPEPRIIRHTYYAHTQPYEDEYAPFWPMDDERQKIAHGWLYENAVDVEINLDTAQMRIVGFAGKALVEPTDWDGLD
jgi:hypothetical protein